MTDQESRLQQASAARQEGRPDEALRLLRQLFAEADSPSVPPDARYFMTMFSWRTLAQDYAPARAALAVARDEQARRLLAGEEEFAGAAGPEEGYPLRRSRFSVVVEMNDILGDAASTRAVFMALVAARPEQARRHARTALPDLVRAGDFALADRYRGDPLEMLEPVNGNARTLPLFPPVHQAPRLAAELMSLARDVRIGMTVLAGLGRTHEAAALEGALLDGLESAELRDWARRELDEDGAISRAIAARHMAHEGAARQAPR